MAIIPEQQVEQFQSMPKLEAVRSGAEADGTQMPLARLWSLWRQRQLLFRAALYGLFASAVIAFLIPSRYQSTTQLMPPDQQEGGGLAMAAMLANKMDSGLAGVAGSVLGLKSSGELFIGILGSRTVQDDLINKFDLRKVYGDRLYQDARRKLAENTSISEDRKSGIISVTVTDKSPQRAAAMAQEYVTQLNTTVSQLTTSSAHRERLFLEGRLAEVKHDLENAEKEFSQFASKNGTIDIKEQGRAMVESAATLEGQLIAAQSELEGLKQIYAENNVRIRSLRARIAELQNQLQQLGGKQQIAEDATNPDSAELYPSIRKLPLLGMTYADLYRKSRVEEAVFETLTQEYELAKVTEAKEIPSVKVLDPPNIPEKKSFPPRLAIMILGMFLCGAVMVVYVLGKARWNEVSAADPQKLFVQEVFQTLNAKMPWAPPNGSRVQAMSHRVWTRYVTRQGATIDEVSSNN